MCGIWPQLFLQAAASALGAGLSEQPPFSTRSDSPRTRQGPGDTGTAGTGCWLCLSQGEELKTAGKINPGLPPLASAKLSMEIGGTRGQSFTPGTRGGDSPCPRILWQLFGHPGDPSRVDGRDAGVPYGNGFLWDAKEAVSQSRGVMPVPGSRGPTAIPAATALSVPVPACPSGAYFSWQSPGRNVSRCRAKVEAGIAGIATG